MTKRDKQAEEYAAESYGKADELYGNSDTFRCANEPRDGAVCQDSSQKNLALTHACMAALRVIENYQREHHARTGDPFALDGMDSGCSAPISHVLKAAVRMPVDDWDFQVAKPVKKPTLTDEERWCLKEMLVLIAFHHEDHQKEAFLLRDMLRRSQ